MQQPQRLEPFWPHVTWITWSCHWKWFIWWNHSNKWAGVLQTGKKKSMILWKENKMLTAPWCCRDTKQRYTWTCERVDTCKLRPQKTFWIFWPKAKFMRQFMTLEKKINNHSHRHFELANAPDGYVLWLEEEVWVLGVNPYIYGHFLVRDNSADHCFS